MLQIHPIPAFDDNYIWVLHDGRAAVVVDPGDAAPVLKFLSKQQLKLHAILVTHHHADHTAGIASLIARFSPHVYAPQYEQYAFAHTQVKDGDTITLPEIGQSFKVMWLPGHTLGHIAYANDAYLFCGDTLFSAGCGRLFEGTPAQMLASLNRLKTLKPQTQVFCTHEYTAKNIAFARTLDPDNQDLIARQQQVAALRAQQLPSLPSSIDLELKINPFLRCQHTAIARNSQAESQVGNLDELSVFTAIRNLRNHY